MEIKKMIKDFSALGEAKKQSSIYVRMVSILCGVIIALILLFTNITIRNMTDKILVVNTGGEFLQLKSMETDKLYETLLKAHCNAVAYYVNSFDCLTITENQARAVFLVGKADLNPIFSKYLTDRAYADAADRGIVYRCAFEKLQRVEKRGDEYNVVFTSVLSIHDGDNVKRIKIYSRGNAIRTTPAFPENVTGFFFRSYTQEYELLTKTDENN